MLCSSCGHENREGQRFCVECGTALALQCPTCGAPVEAEQKFCGECGTALTTAAPAPPATVAPGAVRKTVTVLFADLGGSTGFGERTDAEITRQVLARYHALLQETIDAHAGTVAKFMGDGMMATFGIPAVAEDDARRAVDAGAALQQQFEDFAAGVERRHGETLTLRVGINTGEVVIAAGDADIIGDALNVAARLEKACRPGHVLVGEETWRLTRGDVAYEALGEVTVAGRAQPVAVYEVATDTETAEEVAAPFVGREPEMDRLLAVLDEARAESAARLATVLGSPGVGKTRLSRELCARADAQSVELRCDRAGEATFAPVAQLIRESAGLADGADTDAARASIGTLLPEAEADRGRIVEVLAGLVGAAPARSVEETFWAVRRLVEATAADQPLVIVIDDIQWAEPLLLDLLEHLAEWVDGAAVLLLGLARPELREVRPALAEPGRPVAAVLVLDGLDASATEALAAGLLGTERLPAGLVERLPESTDGNPLFVRELVRMLVDDRVIRRREDGEWELTIDAEAVDVPPTIQSLLGARVERLPATERELLEHASVVGAEFSLGALRELAGDAVPITSLLETMRRKELVEPTGTYWGDEPVHRFHHVLIRDAAYRRILKTTRADLHERVAVWTDRSASNLIGEHEAAIAFHYEQAYRYRSELGALDERAYELGRRAAELLSTAAQRALGRDDLAAAGALSIRALALLPDSDTAGRADVLMLGCECVLASGDGAAARPLVEELGRVTGREDRLSAWADCFAAQLVGLTDPEGLVAADAKVAAAAQTLTELDDGSGQAKAHQVRAGLLARLGRVGDAELELDHALAAAREADDRRRVTAVLGAAPDAALFGPSPVARAGGRCLDVVRLLRITSASPAVEAASNRCQAVLESLRGRFDVSRSMLASARASLEELGLQHGLAQTDLYAGMVELIADDPHAAIPPLRAAFDGLGALGVGADAGIAAALLARALLVDGSVDEADAMATASEHLAGQNLKTAIGWRVARAEVLAARGDLGRAVDVAQQAVEIAAGTDLIIDHADACVALAGLRARAGDEPGARAARADARRLYEQKGATVPAARLGEATSPTVGAPTVPVSPPRASPAPGLENTASRAYAAVMEVLSGRVDGDLAELVAPGFRHDDRRPVVNYGVTKLAESAAQVDWLRDEGFQMSAPQVIAVRGERVALTWNDTRTSTGDDISSLCVVEVDEHGRLVLLTQFDESDQATATDHLDQRFIAVEGEEHADLVGLVSGWISVFEHGDVDRIRQLVGPGFVWVDHQQLGWGTLGVDQIVELFRALNGVQNAVIVTREMVLGKCILFTAANHATDAAGGEVLWSFHTVGVADSTGLTTRVEIFAEEDWDAALARLHELGTVRTGSPWLENAASHVWAQALVASNEGDQDTLADLVAPAYHLDARQRLTGAGAFDRGDARTILSISRDQGFEYGAPSVIAVRGDRLALCQGGSHTPAGDEDLGLQLIEIDDRDRMVATVVYDETDLAAALTELDARYLAGEGAAHADLLTASERSFRALEEHDEDAVRGLAAPGFVMVEHRLLGWPQLDLEGFLEMQRVYADVEHSFRATSLRLADRVGMFTITNPATDATGSDVEWVFHMISVIDADARTTRIETFAEDQWDTALARFDALATAKLRGPRLENTASRVDAQVIALFASGSDRELAALAAPEFEFDDRRHVVNFGVTGRAEAASELAWLRDQGFQVTIPKALAIRGDRLVLSRRNRRTPAGDDLVSLAVVEVDEHGRLLALIQFDDDKLDDALAELDARFIAGEGAEHADLLRVFSTHCRAVATRDEAAIRELASSGFEYVDHRLASWGELSRRGFAQMNRAYADLENTMVLTKLYLARRLVLAHLLSSSVSDDGVRGEWAGPVLFECDRDGRSIRLEVFAEDQWDAALARFDELGAATERSGPPAIENAASRLHARVVDATASGNDEEIVALLAREFRYHDRRSVVNMGDDNDLATAAAHLEQLREAHYEWRAPTSIAVRGERLALARSVFRTDSGDDSSSLVLVESDADDRLLSITQLDEEALDDAVDELEARYVAGEGEAHTEIVAINASWVRALNTHDFDALRDISAPDIAFVDHRQLGWAAFDIDGFIEWYETYADVRFSFVSGTLRVRDRVALTTNIVSGVDPDGGEVVWAYHSVFVTDADGRTRRAETFDEDQWEEALARFDELAAEPVHPRPPQVENAASRVWARIADLMSAGPEQEIGDLTAPDFRYDDRSAVVNFGVQDRAGAAHHLLAFREQGWAVEASGTIAVRGERLALSRSDSRTAGGDEIGSPLLVEIDEQGRLLRCTKFGEEDLAAAVDELDARYVAGEGAGHARTVEVTTGWMRALEADDHDAMRALAAPGIVFVDHRQIGFATLDLDQFFEWQALTTDLRTSYLATSLQVRDLATLVTIVNHAVDADGGEFVWRYHTVGARDGDGRITRVELFPEDAWDAALARFDELAAEPSSDGRTPEVVNASTAALDRLWAVAHEQRFDELRSLLAVDVQRIDRRKGVSAPPTHGVDEYLEVLHAAFDRSEVGQVVVTPLAVRGDRCSLSRVVALAFQFEISLIMLTELDEDERVSFLASYDEDDFAAALTELDDRFIAGEGAPHAALLTAGRAFITAVEANDAAALEQANAPGHTYADHRKFGWEGGADEYAQTLAEYEDVQRAYLVTKILLGSNTALASVVNRGIDPRGNEVIWLFHSVAAFDREARFRSSELYDDWDAALARFDELSAAEPSDARLENAASRRYAATVRAVASGADAELSDLVAPEFRWNDRRRVVNFGDNDRSGAIEHILYNRAQGFETSVVDVVAVRGDRFALSRTRMQKAADDDTATLDLIELDERGRLLETTHFDDEDLGIAVDELDQRYFAGEGAEHAAVLQPFAEYWRCYNARHWDEARGYVSADFTFVDHGLIGAGSSVQSADQLMQFVQGLIDQVPDLVAYESEHLAVGRAWILSRHVARGTSTHGAEVATEHLLLTEVRDGRSTRTEAYDVDQIDEARARFEEVEAREPSS